MPVRALPISGLNPCLVASDPNADPAGRLFRSLALARCLGAISRLGILAELARTTVDANELATRFALEVDPLRLTLDVLVSEGLLARSDLGYTITADARPHLDPDSPTSVATLISYTVDHWKRWAELEFVLAGGRPSGGRPDPGDELGWLRRVRGQYEYARRIGDAALASLQLPAQATSVLDLGGSHGWFSAALCRRHPQLRAVVIDEAPAVAIGRELMWEAGLDGVVSHVAGDIYTAVLGGPHDVAICLPLLHGLDRPSAITLLTRIRASMREGGTLLVLRPNRGNRQSSGGRAGRAGRLRPPSNSSYTWTVATRTARRRPDRPS